MGGTVATLLLREDPAIVDGLIMGSPMLQINTGPFLPPLLVELVSHIMCAAGQGSRYVFGGSKFNAGLRFEGNPLTSDPIRFRRNINYVVEQEHLALGSPTFGWLKQAYIGMRKARRSSN